MLSPGSLDDKDMTVLAHTMLPLVRQEDLVPIDFEFFSGWHDFAELVKAMGDKLAHGFETFLRGKYWIVTEKVVKERIAAENQQELIVVKATFTPSVPINHEVSPAVVAHRETLTQQLDMAHQKIVDDKARISMN